MGRLRERKPLVHQITNYVVMNETANATLALGALPVMAHAPEEVEEMVGYAGALVLNIGTLSAHWVEAMLAAGRAANERGVPVVLDPVGVGATRFRTDTAKRILDEVDVAVLRGQRRRGRDPRRGRGRGARRRVDRRRRRAGRARPRGGPLARRCRLGDRRRRPRLRRRAECGAISNGDPMLASITGHGLHVDRRHRLLPRRRRVALRRARSRRSSRSASPARTRRAGARRARARSTSTSTTRWRRSIRPRSTGGRRSREGARDRRAISRPPAVRSRRERPSCSCA